MFVLDSAARQGGIARLLTITRPLALLQRFQAD
jgi:hypothetical protein